MKQKNKPTELTQLFSHKQYLHLAIPLIISGISTPLLGAVDTAVIGRMADTAAIGGVAVAAVIFNTMYWLFGFLRVSTSGFTSQAEGAKNEQEVIMSLLRPACIALLVGFLFVILQQPIFHLSSQLIGGSSSVLEHASDYFVIRIWSAPFLLLSYVVIGWLIGMGKVRLSLATQITMNVMNIILDVVFVIGMKMGVSGVAYATLISEISGVLIGILIVLYQNRKRFTAIRINSLLDVQLLIKMWRVNRDLFLRTVCLLTMTLIFTATSSAQGEIILAANAILL
ncbi:MATE family efflux transporter, partial [Gracilibacillus oryzae]